MDYVSGFSRCVVVIVGLRLVRLKCELFEKSMKVGMRMVIRYMVRIEGLFIDCSILLWIMFFMFVFFL